MTKKFGRLIAECVTRRLDDIHAASSLNDLRFLPGKIAAISKISPVLFEIQLGNSTVLLIAPEPAISKLHDTSDWSNIKSVQILGVKHE